MVNNSTHYQLFPPRRVVNNSTCQGRGEQSIMTPINYFTPGRGGLSITGYVNCSPQGGQSITSPINCFPRDGRAVNNSTCQVFPSGMGGQSITAHVVSPKEGRTGNNNTHKLLPPGREGWHYQTIV